MSKIVINKWMNVDEKFTFGKYKGVLLSEVYTGLLGSNFWLNEYIDIFFKERIEKPWIWSDIRNVVDIDMNLPKLEVSVTSKSQYDIRRFDLSNYFNLYFRNLNHRPDSQFGEINLDDILESNLQHKEITSFPVSGQPDYISWCISELAEFSIDPAAIEILEKSTVFEFKGLIFSKKIGKIYALEPDFDEKKFNFVENIIQSNSVKLSKHTKPIKSIIIEELYYYEDNEDCYENESNESSCACGENPCGCSDPDPG